MNTLARLKQLGITLPAPNQPGAAYVMVAQSGSLLFVAGHIARQDGKPLAGQLGKEFTTEQGKAAARSVALDLLSTLNGYLGDLDRVQRIVKVMCLVNSVPAFTEQHLVANGCSELLLEVLGERGRHARSAFGVAQIPLGACVEIELVVEATNGPAR
jgi:enamine deaminase RidA (YjgF/YER057c/UK114 family)